MKIALIILVVTIVLFVPLYPFRFVRRIAFFLLNRFVPLPLKFDDIGGIPIIGIRLFNVRIALRGESTLQAREMRIRINFQRMLLLRRPTVDPVTFFDPVIHLYREKERGEIWFLFPLNLARRVVGLIFSNIWGVNRVRIVNGTLVLHAGKGNTEITHMSGEFLSLGALSTVRTLECRIGDGVIRLEPAGPDPEADIRVTAHEIPLEALTALKIPQHLTGDVEIRAVMRGGFGPPVLDGELRAAGLFLRGAPIRNVQSPLHFEGTTFSLTSLRGDVEDYLLTGLLESDVVTDIVRLKLHGSGTGRGPGDIFQMISMKPYISSAQFDGRIDLKGDFERFDDITGEIDIRLRDVRLNPQALSPKARPDAALPRVPVLNFDMFMQEGSLYIEGIEALLPGTRLNIGGRIDMVLDEVLEKVTDTVYDLTVSVKDDATVSADHDPRRTMSIPVQFDGRMRLDTHQTDDSADFQAAGSVDVKNIALQTALIPALKRLGGHVDLSLRRVSGEIEITAEHFLLKNVYVDAKWMALDVGGKIGLDGALDLFARARVLSSAETADANFMHKLLPGLAKRLRAVFHVTGTTARPKIRLARAGDPANPADVKLLRGNIEKP